MSTAWRAQSSRSSRNGHPASQALDDRLPRYNPQHESGVLGGLLLEPEQMAGVLNSVKLCAHHFYSDRHRAIFEVMVELHSHGKCWNCDIVATELERRQQFEVMGGDNYLAQIVGLLPHAKLTLEHAAYVKEDADCRLLQQAADNLARDALSRQFTAAQILERHTKQLEEVQPATAAAAYDEKGRINWTRLSNEDMGMKLASSITPKRTEWLMPDRIPSLAYTLIAGEGKQGKSQFTMALGALFSTGGEWWDGSGCAKRGHVLYLSAEDDAERAVRPRLEALGADLDMITVLEARYKIPADDGKEPLVAFAELGDLIYWREVFRRVKDPLVMFIDPLPSYIGRGVNDRKNSEVRAILGPFIAMAVEFGISIIGVTHLGKSIDPTKPIANRVLDSIAYTNLARAIHFIARDPEDHDRKFFMPGPCNYAPGGLESLAFKLIEKEVKTADGETLIVAVAEFEPATVDVDAQDVVSVVGKKRPGPQSKIRQQMAEWLYDRLKDGLPVQAFHIYNDCAEAFDSVKPHPMGIKDENGYWTKARTLRRAADVDLPLLAYPQNGKRVDIFKDSSQNNRSYWRLVDNRPDSEEETHAPF
ncbi:MAG: AAA family ATPase [Isosphaeraceae bacterium]